MSTPIGLAPESTIVARAGQPLRLALDLDGDQSGTDVRLTVAPRWAAVADVPVIDEVLVLEAAVVIDGITVTPAAVVLTEAQIDTLVVGLVYVYHVRINDGPSAIWGLLEIARAWL